MALKVFLVEDNPAIRDSLSEALSDLAGMETCGFAGTERGAVQWLTDPAHEWDLAIVDLVLDAGGSGLGVLQALQGRAAHRKVVVLTATASMPVKQHCEALGCDTVFDKSMDTDALLAWCIALAQGPLPKGTDSRPGVLPPV